MRSANRPLYLSNLTAVLGENRVRFHIKRLVLQWLAAATDPLAVEWAVLKTVAASEPTMWPHVRATVVASPAWFDVLDGAGFFADALSSGDGLREQEAVWFLSFNQVLAARPDAVASILQRHRRPGDPWSQLLRHVCSTGQVYHSRTLFDLFLSLIDDGTLDQLRPGFATNDDWWTVLYDMSEKRPDWTSEAIAHWLDHTTAHAGPPTDWDGPTAARVVDRLGHLLDSTGASRHVIVAAATAASAFVRHMLPRIAAIVAATVREVGDGLASDPLFSGRYYSDPHTHVHSTLLSALADALEVLAKTDPDELDRATAPYVGPAFDTIAYLLLRAWTAAPAMYADRLADYLAADGRRLKVGYSSWVGSGSAANLTSRRAVKAVSQHASNARVAKLEGVILALTDAWESRYPAYRGRQQLELLSSMDVTRLGPRGRAKLAEWRAKFPGVRTGSGDEPRRSSLAGVVGPPIPLDAQSKMSDANWLKAMQTYAGVHDRHHGNGGLTGGEYELASAIQGRAKAEPARFCALADQMSDEYPAAYFDAIVRGVSESPAKGETATPPVSTAVVAGLIRRVHALANQPCARAVAWLMGQWPDTGWPDDIIDVLMRYAVTSPDPADESSPGPADGVDLGHARDPHFVGINSVRGSAAGAIASLLFYRTDRFARLRPTIRQLAMDRSTAVRSCAAEALIATLNADEQLAIDWFNECVDGRPDLLATPHVGRFVWYAGYRNYAAVQPVYQAMLDSGDAKVVEGAAGQVSVTALTIDEAASDANRVRSGNVTCRKAAAGAYAANAADAGVGRKCRDLLKSLFSDPDETVRIAAASALRHLPELATADQAELLEALLDAGPDAAAIAPAIRAVEESPVQLPVVVCRLVEAGVAAGRGDASDISKGTAGVAMGLAAVAVRLYSNTNDEAIRSRCLDAFDEMERHNFMGLSGELQKLDR